MYTHQLPDYAELHALSNFSFQRGASHPHELVERAFALGYKAIAITDECSVAGVVRAHEAAKKIGMQLLPGAEFLVTDKYPFRIIVLPHNANGWGNLCEFITLMRKGSLSVTKNSAPGNNCIPIFLAASCARTTPATEHSSVIAMAL